MQRIALVLFDGISLFHLAAPFAVFGEDWRGIGLPRFDLRLCAAQAGAVADSAGFSREVAGPEVLAEADLIVIPSWTPERPSPPELLKSLRAAHGRGARLAGLCLGAYPLAESGLLDGRTATTHWAWTADFSARFPRVAIDPLALYVDEGALVTSAGAAAALDCCLHLLRRAFGDAAAARLARRLVVAPFRQGGQAQYAEPEPPPHHSDGGLERARAWALDRLRDKPDIDGAAAQAGMSRRSFTRHFKRVHGESFGAWLEREKLSEARRRLERTADKVEAIAGDCGFSGALALRAAFLRHFDTTPSRYRREFCGGAR
ncbi:transcriptional regulator GlxA family with amidase domain [Rhodoblastus acidophilus]|uniref:GlxA family transcriptional regulator n=1 Tax=Rhodoblastus acidophilus TaxID=1074 RepID=UPI0022249D91|nr:helix-turn-helix domain-containing protein [Rhodoblastus acidophilus]MCW2286485.1 transcriptional regulator GlxA family with amidase domain [Rhodoblastus acidophilus]MCW2335327.1 transcriptional regulator GlxA family with amidase domain [Rhodoblastus acidophilus]